MFTRDKWRGFLDSPVVEWSMFALGLLLLIVSPLVGAIPGPGGIIVAGIGLALVLRTSMWAKRHYVRFKRWQPKAGRWTDWALRRPSAKRREAIRKASTKPKPRREANAIDLAPPSPIGAHDSGCLTAALFL